MKTNCLASIPVGILCRHEEFFHLKKTAKADGHSNEALEKLQRLQQVHPV